MERNKAVDEPQVIVTQKITYVTYVPVFFSIVNQKNSLELRTNFFVPKMNECSFYSKLKVWQADFAVPRTKVIKCEAVSRGRERKFGFSAAFWFGQWFGWSAASGKDRGSRTLLSRLIWAVRMSGLVPSGNTASPKRCGRADCKRANKVFLSKVSKKKRNKKMHR